MHLVHAFTRTAGKLLQPTYALPEARLSAGVVLFAILASAVTILVAPFQVPLWNFKNTIYVVSCYVSLVVALSALLIRLENDNSRPARVMNRVGQAATDFSLAAIAVTIFGDAARLLQTIPFWPPVSFRDHYLSAADLALGFDWEYTVGLLNSSPLVAKALVYAYFSIHVTVPLLMVVQIILRRRQELWELIALLLLGGVFSIIGACFVPAVAAYAYYAPSDASFSQFAAVWPGGSDLFLQGMLKLTTGQLTELDLNDIKGILTFPSFHGVMAMALIYMAWPYRLLAVPYLLINLAMIVSTVPVGGHYAIDCVGSLVVVLASIAIIDAVAGRPSLWARVKSVMAREPAPQLAPA